MLKKTITYTDFNGIERTEDFYFHFMKSEVMEMELGTTGGMAELINRIIATRDIPEISKLFKRLILESYGVKSPDGKSFIKTQELRDEFVQSEAYSILFMELLGDAEKMAEFVNKILPQDVNKPSIPAPALN